MDVESMTANRKQEVESTKTMIERVEQRFGITPQRLIRDTAYGTAPMLGWLVEEKHIAPHVPVWDKTERKDGTFSRSDFKWDEQHNEYRCPAGKALHPRQRNFKKLPTLITEGTVRSKDDVTSWLSCVRGGSAIFGPLEQYKNGDPKAVAFK
jgi:hypothetical protein